MNYTRKYPNNLAIGGTTVFQGFQNDDLEIKNIYDILSKKADGADNPVKDSVGGFLPSNHYQSVLTCSYDSVGYPNFLFANANSRTVGYNAQDRPLVLNFAYGLNSDGTVKSFTKALMTTNAVAWSLIPWTPGTHYLYVDYLEATDQLRFGTAELPCLVSYAEPANPVVGQHYFNPNTMFCYECDSIENLTTGKKPHWSVKTRLFVGQYTVSGDTKSCVVRPITSLNYGSDNGVLECDKNGTVFIHDGNNRKLLGTVEAKGFYADGFYGPLNGTAQDAKKLDHTITLNVVGDAAGELIVDTAKDKAQLNLEVTKAAKTARSDYATMAGCVESIKVLDHMPTQSELYQLGNVFMVVQQ